MTFYSIFDTDNLEIETRFKMVCSYPDDLAAVLSRRLSKSLQQLATACALLEIAVYAPGYRIIFILAYNVTYNLRSFLNN